VRHCPAALAHCFCTMPTTRLHVLLCICVPLQVIAYNKVDLPDSGDYWEFVKEYLRVSTHTYKHVRLSLVLSLSLCLDRRIAYQPASHQTTVELLCEPVCPA
jgi:hypothetical protein